MDGIFLIAFLVHGGIFATFNWVVANEKNRDLTGWTFAGFFFGIIALIALSGLDTLKKSETAHEENAIPQEDDDKAEGINDNSGESHWVCTCGAENEYDHGLKDQICKKCSRGRNVVLGITN